MRIEEYSDSVLNKMEAKKSTQTSSNDRDLLPGDIVPSHVSSLFYLQHGLTYHMESLTLFLLDSPSQKQLGLTLLLIIHSLLLLLMMML